MLAASTRAFEIRAVERSVVSLDGGERGLGIWGRRKTKLVEQAPYALRARELLVQHGWASRPDMESVARALGLSVRSLRRHLAAEGESYHVVEREALATVAAHLLRDERRTIREIASEMGFSDTGTFHRAFRRWTGTTPSAYRREQLEQESCGT